MRQLYQATAVPKMLYAADLWFTLAHHEGTDTLQRGSLGVAKKLTSIQRIAAIAITGAMRSTATDVLEVHTNLLPMTLLLQNTCYRAVIRLTAHPDTHPLYTSLRKAAKQFVSSHHSSLHRLTHFFQIEPDEIESLIPAWRAPTSVCPHKTHIAASREDAIVEHVELQGCIQVYSDGLGHNGQIGAAAILFRAGG
jgi:hypothetical protein